MKYYVNNNRQEGSGDNNEVHREGCYWLLKVSDKTFLGDFPSCYGAVAKAKLSYPNTADGCKYCCLECHNE